MKMKAKEVLEYVLSDKPKRIILDTDAANEADDQFAIAYAALCPNLTLEAATAAPFTHTDGSDAGEGAKRSLDEAEKVISLAGTGTPCHAGASSFMGFGGIPVASPAAQAIIDAAHAPGEPLIVVGIGAGTNIASALMIAPDIADKMIVLWQAGNSPENGSGGEYNMCGDINAAKVIFSSRVPLVLCPAYDAAACLSVTLGELDANLTDTPVNNYLREQLYRYVGTTAPETKKVVWDIGVIGLLSAHAGTCEVRERPSVCDGGTYGRGRGEFTLVTSLDRDAVYADMYKILGGAK